MKRKKRIQRLSAVILCLVLVLPFAFRTPVYAAVSNMGTAGTPAQETAAQQNEDQAVGTGIFSSYQSWIQGSRIWNNTYGNVNNSDTDELAEVGDEEDAYVPDEPNWAERTIANILAGIGNFVYWLASTFHMTTNEVVLGRLVDGVTVNMYTFELTEANPYGMTGAVIYALFRNIALFALAIQFALIFFRAAINNTPKAITQFKDDIMTFIVILLLMAVMPQIIDILIFVRDLLIKMVMELIYGSSDSAGAMAIVEFFKVQFYGDTTANPPIAPTKTILFGFLYLMSTFIGFRFGIDYIKIALKQTALFIILPFVLLLSVSNRRILDGWLRRFIPNIFIPTIDNVLLMIPIVFAKVTAANLAATSAGATITSTTGESYEMISGVIQIIMMYSIIPVRELVLEVLGALPDRQRGGAGVGRAMGSMLAGALMRGAMSGGRGHGGGGAGAGSGGSGGGSGSGGFASGKEQAQFYQREADMNRALNDGVSGADSFGSGYASEAGSGIGSSDSGSGNTSPSQTSVEETDRNVDNYLNGNGGDLTPEENQDAYSSGGAENVEAELYDGGAEDYVDVAEETPVTQPDANDFDSRMDNLENMEAAQAQLSSGESELADLKLQEASANSELTAAKAEMNELQTAEETMLEGSGFKNYDEYASAQQAQQDLATKISSVNDTMLENSAGYKQAEENMASGTKFHDLSREEQLSHQNYTQAQSQHERLSGQYEANQTKLDALEPNKERLSANHEKLQQARRNVAEKSADWQNLHAQSGELSAKNGQLKDNIRNMQNTEDRYAQTNRLNGGGGESYKSPAELKRAENMRKLANYSNYDNRDMSKVLTSQEKADFARQRQSVEMRRALALGAAVGTTTVLGATIGAAASAGDDRDLGSNIRTGAMAGFIGSAKVSGKVLHSAANAAETRMFNKQTGNTPAKKQKPAKTSPSGKNNAGSSGKGSARYYEGETFHNSDTTGASQKKLEDLRNKVDEELI